MCPILEIQNNKSFSEGLFNSMGSKLWVEAKELSNTPEQSNYLLEIRSAEYTFSDLNVNTINNQQETEHISARQLFEKEAYLRSILRAAPVGMGVVINRVFKFVNERITQITGYSSAELMDQSARMLYPTEKEYLQVGDKKYGEIRQYGTGSVETRWLCKDKTIKNILLSSTPIDPENLQKGVTFTALDITNRIKAEKKANTFEKVIKDIQKGLASEVGESFFETAIKKFSQIIKADYAFIGELNPLHQNKITTITFFRKGKIADGFHYPLENSPSKKVISDGVFVAKEAAYKLFQLDTFLNEHKIEGYIGIRLKDSQNKIVGLMVAMFNKPIANLKFIKSVMRIFSTRTGVEVERRIYEQKLTKANDLFRTIAENIPDIILRVDTNLRCLYVSPEVKNYAGFGHDIFTGKKLSELNFESGFASDREKDLKSVLKLRKPLQKIVSVNSEKGQRVLEWRFIPEFNQEGKIESILNIVRDLTESQRTENELNQLFNLSADMICIALTSGELVKVNPAWEHILGYSHEELISSLFTDYIHPDDLQATLDIISTNLAQNKMVYGFENRYRCKDGSYKWLSWVSQPIGIENQLFAIARDISEQKNTFRELVEAKNKAEESDRLKSAFLANMSHEIRTPMNAIIGFATLMEREQITVEQRKRYVKIIQSRSDDLLSIINDILDISKIESGQLQITKAEFSINELFEELYADYQHKLSSLPGKKLYFAIGKRADKNFNHIKNDRLRIKQILINLLDNAIKFTAEGQINYGVVCHLNTIQFYVSDTGSGIAPDKKEAIFERFRQADESTTRNYGGNGLGLSISRALAEMMGGQIWVESELGAGSTFYFTVPYEKAQKTRMREFERKIGAGMSMKGSHILVVEDDPMSRQFLLYILQRVGAEVTLAHSGNDALSLYSEKPTFDLILMDIQLPDINGFEVCSAIRKQNTEIPILAQTAFPMDNDQKQSLKAGCSGYLQKPVRPDELLSNIYHLLAK